MYRRLVALGGAKLFTLKDAVQYLDLPVTKPSLSHTLSLLEEDGIIERLGRGLYLNKSTGNTPRIIDLIADVFKENPHYLGLNAAASHWGLTVQIPNAYHVIYSPKNQAERKRIARWCKLLEGKNEMGGVLVPTRTRNQEVLLGTSQVIMEGVQLRVSTLERTLIDSTLYSEKIGGAGVALQWIENALTPQTKLSVSELSKLLETIQSGYHSVTARMGFLLERALTQRSVAGDREREIRILLRHLERRAAATYSSYWWGPAPTTKKRRDLQRADDSEYFKRWRLHVSSKYLEQLQVLGF